MLSVCKEYQSDIMDDRSNCAVSLLGVYRSADYNGWWSEPW